MSLSYAPDGLGDRGVGDSVGFSYYVPGTHTPTDTLSLETCKLTEQLCWWGLGVQVQVHPSLALNLAKGSRSCFLLDLVSNPVMASLGCQLDYCLELTKTQAARYTSGGFFFFDEVI